MDQKMKRRIRALAWALACTVGGLTIAGRAFGQDDAVERLRAAVQLDALQLRMQLDQEESGRDWNALLAHKVTVDSALAPLHLIRDAMDSLANGSPGVDLLRSFRTEWRDDAVIANWSHPDGAERARRSLAAWAPMSPRRGLPAEIGTAADEERSVLRIEVQTGSESWVNCDAPPMIGWTIDAAWEATGAALHARSWWRIPIAEPMRIDFPLAPDGLDIWLNSTGARLRDDRGNTHAETWEPVPIFNNPPDIYAVFDALRLVGAKDYLLVNRQESSPSNNTMTAVVAAPSNAATQIDDFTAPIATLRIRTITRTDGTLLRTERWSWIGNELRSVVIDQSPVRLMHHSEQGVEIVTELEGVEASRTPHRARSEIVQFPLGARIAIAFRSADPERDRVAKDEMNATVPDRMALIVDGRCRAWATFTSVRLMAAVNSDPWCIDRDSRLLATESTHSALAAQFAAAISAQSIDEVQRALAAINAQHEACEATTTERAAEWELAAMHILDGGMDAACDATLIARWIPITSRDDALLAIRRWKSAGYGRFATRLALIADISDDEVAHTGTSHAGDQPGWDATDGINADDSLDPLKRVSTECDASLLHDGALVLHDAVQAEIISHVRDKFVSSAMIAELCLVCSQHSADLYEINQSRADAIASDARAVLSVAIQDGSAVSDPMEYSVRFATDTVSAALRDPLDEDAISATRAGWDICAHATIAALQKACRDGATAQQSASIRSGAMTDTDATQPTPGLAFVAALQRELHIQRAMVGNSYCPALIAPAGILLPDASSVSRNIDRMIRSTMDSERRRVDITGALLGEHLGAARGATSQRRMVSATVKLTIGVFMQWCASGARPDE